MGDSKWCISRNDETGYFGDYSTKAEAIAAAVSELDLAPGERFFVGEAVQSPPIPSSPDAESVIDHAICCAADNYGEASDGWLSHVDKPLIEDLQRRLSAAWAEWIHANRLEADFWTIPDVEEASNG